MTGKWSDSNFQSMDGVNALIWVIGLLVSET